MGFFDDVGKGIKSVGKTIVDGGTKVAKSKSFKKALAGAEKIAGKELGRVDKLLDTAGGFGDAGLGIFKTLENPMVLLAVAAVAGLILLRK